MPAIQTPINDASNMPRILVMNKIDRMSNTAQPELRLIDDYASIVSISARNNIGLDLLTEAITNTLEQNKIIMTITLPYQNGKEYSYLYENKYILSESTDELGWKLNLSIPKTLYNQYKIYLEEDENSNAEKT